MQVQTYLFFNGRCEEALGFYREKLGAEMISMTRFKDMPQDESAPPSENCPGPTSELAEKIMHAEFRLGDVTLFASDGMEQSDPKFEGFSITMSVAKDDEAKRFFDLLAEEGAIIMPLTPMFFASLFGIVTDKFGVSWMILSKA